MAKLTLSFKGHFISTHLLDDEEFVIGREPDCSVAIDSLAVGPRHARVIKQDEGYEIVALDKEYALLVNHNPVTQVRLQHGDRIQIGKHTFSFAESAFQVEFATEEAEMEVKPVVSDTEQPSTNPAPPPPGTGWLQILDGSHLGRIIPLSSQLTRVGKTGKDCAVIARRNDGYYLSHLTGEHFPLIDDESIGEQRYLLQDGDIIQIGSIRLLFSGEMETSP